MIKPHQYPTPAKRPAYSVLHDGKRIVVGLNLPPWQDALARCLQDISAKRR
ncbi:MAG: sugar nucleotide-binding protein [Arenicellales bacterium WSBS_2016_MAG_OTU3]